MNYKLEFVLNFKKECKEYSNLFSLKWENIKFLKEGKESNENDYLFNIGKFSDDNKILTIERHLLEKGNIDLKIELLYEKSTFKSYFLNVKFFQSKVISYY